MNICAFCFDPVNTEDEENYREVSSWVNGPKLDGPKLREQTGRVAHKLCVEHLVAGQAPDQPELFDDGIEVTHVRGVDGKCRLSLNGQGHLPCEQHPPLEKE